MGQRRRTEFASKLVSHGVCHEAAVGSLLASEWDNAGGRVRQQAGLPRSVSRSRCGKLACKRMGQRRRPYSPASWSPTECATKPLWEACLQANGATPEDGIRQQAGLPRSVPRSRCGKLACKRMGQRRRPYSPASWSPTECAPKPLWEACLQANGSTPEAVFASKLVSHGVCHEAAVGSLLASEWDNAGGRIRQQAGLPRNVPRSRCGKLACKRMGQCRRPCSPASWSRTECAPKPPWEACLQANGSTPEAVFASKLVSHGMCHEAAVGSLLASEWDNAGGRVRQQAGLPRSVP